MHCELSVLLANVLVVVAFALSHSIHALCLLDMISVIARSSSQNKFDRCIVFADAVQFRAGPSQYLMILFLKTRARTLVTLGIKCATKSKHQNKISNNKNISRQ